jgi:radical SAM protein with 4Fe4S-binding SPASM domain
MSKEQLNHIVNELRNHGTLKIVITGGEPMLHPDFFWLISEFAKFSSVTVNTNGTYLFEYVDLLEKYDFKKRLSFNVSIDSLIKEKNSTTRGYYDIDKIIDNVILLSNAGYRMSILSTVTNLMDEDDLTKLQEFNKKNPEIGLGLNDLKLTGRASDAMTKLLPDLETVKKINKKYTSFQNFSYDEQCNNSEMADLLTCGAGKECLSIAESGDVYPCTAMYIKAGNIFENTIREICDQSPIIRELSEMRHKKIDSVSECDACRYKNLCHGGCRANAYIATGSLYGVDPYCWYNGKYFRKEI